MTNAESYRQGFADGFREGRKAVGAPVVQPAKVDGRKAGNGIKGAVHPHFGKVHVLQIVDGKPTWVWMDRLTVQNMKNGATVAV